MISANSCEDYVVKKLAEMETENVRLKENLEALGEGYQTLSVKFLKLKKTLKRIAKVKTLDSGSRSLSFNSLYDWDEKEKEDLELFLNYLELNDMEVEDGNAESNC